jgi:hypothetical protein
MVTPTLRRVDCGLRLCWPADQWGAACDYRRAHAPWQFLMTVDTLDGEPVIALVTYEDMRHRQHHPLDSQRSP